MKRSALNLKQTQHLLFNLITAPEGVEKALKDSPRAILPIKGDDRLSSEERLDIYANMYFYRIRDALKEDFPVLLKVLGEIGFHNLITDYLLKFPSTHYSLRYAGQHLARFLKHHPFSQKKTYLSDLAQMEWALLEAFDAPDSEVLMKKDLEMIKPEQWSGLHLQLIPSFCLIKFDKRIDQIHEKVLGGKPLTRMKPEKVFLKFWRYEFKVFYRPVDNLEQKLLKEIQDGATFGELCEKVAKKMDANRAVSVIASYLHSWIQEGLLKK
jgi:hypothetical protein